MPTSLSTRVVLYFYGVVIIFLLYLPLVSVGFASISKARYLSFPIKRYSTKWYGEAVQSSTVSELLTTSLWVAILVTIVSIVIGFFGALAFARYQWRVPYIVPKIDPFAYLFSSNSFGFSSFDVVQFGGRYTELEDCRRSSLSLDRSDCYVDCVHPCI